VSAAKADQLRLFMGSIALYFGNHTKHTNVSSVDRMQCFSMLKRLAYTEPTDVKGVGKVETYFYLHDKSSFTENN
jgi:hypothetical protein